MFSTRIRRLIQHQWAGLIALFLVLSGGSAWALDGSNTVFTDDIVNGEVRTGDLGAGAVATDKIAQGAVTTERVRNDNLTGGDVLANSLKGSDIDESTLSNIGGGGPAGGDLTGTYPNPLIAARAVDTPELQFQSVTDDQLAVGAVGSQALINIQHFHSTVSVPPMGGVAEVSQNCPSGELISGGAVFDFPSGDISASYPSSIGSWAAEGQNNGTVAQNLTVWVLCLPREP